MVAYSFQKQFAEPIVERRKRQTIRGNRKRHARVGDELQLYTGMRTKHCRLILRTRCSGVYPIVMCPLRHWAWVGLGLMAGHGFAAAEDLGFDEYGMTGRFVAPYLPALARADGFTGWDDMRQFWLEHHEQARDGQVFHGVVVCWGDRA